MNGFHDRSLHALGVAAALLMLALAGACSKAPAWSTDEIENGKHFTRSLDANRKAMQLARKSDPDVPQLGIGDINKYQGLALNEAKLVDDAVLDKAHPDLKLHFRTEYQRGLESILGSYSPGIAAESGAAAGAQIDLQAAGVRLLKRWNDWLDAHGHEISMPDQSKTHSG